MLRSELKLQLHEVGTRGLGSCLPGIQDNPGGMLGTGGTVSEV